MAHCKSRGKHEGGQVAAVDRKKDERCAGRNGQQEDNISLRVADIVEYPADVVQGDADNRSDDARRESQWRAIPVDNETEASNS